jgi:hypothetical protein
MKWSAHIKMQTTLQKKATRKGSIKRSAAGHPAIVTAKDIAKNNNKKANNQSQQT